MTRFSVRAARPEPPTSDIAKASRMGEPTTRPDAISLTDRFVTRNGRPWIPVMGEYHFSRDRAANWETELLKMKSGGVTVVSTYVIWILHEERRGELRWDGNRDLRRFIELTAKHELSAVVRIGPWAHGEARNGGFPDWLQALDIAHRTNDPAYLDLVAGWYRAIADQLSGLFRSAEAPRNPIIGIQVENELYDQPQHLARLRELAEDAGMRAPLWTATGWGGAQLPDEVMPIFGGYSDAFWDEASTGWPASARLHFMFHHVRDDLSVGADLRETTPEVPQQDERYPFVTCELGAGMGVAYHRRPMTDPIDTAALAVTKLGSGSAWQGYYLYHGGTHPIGVESTTQESHDTGYPNDLPVVDYDYAAPIGADGRVREHYHLLRLQHLFLEQHGEALAPLPSIIPRAERGGPRWSFRGDNEAGFLFFNNHQPAGEPLPALPDVQFEVEFGDHAVRLPSAPCPLPASVYGIWPVRRPFGSIRSLSGTAQPVTELNTADGPMVVFAACPGIPVEFLLEGIEVETVSGATSRALPDGQTLILPSRPPGIDCVVTVGDTRVLVLDAPTATRLWRGNVAGRDTLVIWSDALVFDTGRLRLITTEASSRLATFPPLRDPIGEGIVHLGQLGIFSQYSVAGPVALPMADVEMIDLPTAVAPRRTGGSSQRLSAPCDADFVAAGCVDVRIPDDAFIVPTDRVTLSVDWVGDVGRAFVGSQLVSDQFWSGRPWDIELGPIRDSRSLGVTIRALPWNPESGVFVDPRVRPKNERPVLAIRAARLIRSREVVVNPAEEPDP